METALKIVSARYSTLKGGSDPDFLTPLTPNMLLTDRANTEIPVRDSDNSTLPQPTREDRVCLVIE